MHTTTPEIRHDDQIESFWVSLYFLSRDRSVLFCTAGTILAFAILLAWVLRAPERATIRALAPLEVVRTELVAAQPDFSALSAALPAILQDDEKEAVELKTGLEQAIASSKLSGTEQLALTRYWQSLRTAAGEPDATLLVLAHQPTPLPRANELIADLQTRADRFPAAVMYLEREVEVSGADSARSKLINLLLRTRDGDRLTTLSIDPSFASYFTPLVRLQMAREQQSWRNVMAALADVELEALRPMPLTLSIVAGLAWFAIALQAIQPVRAAGFRTIAPALAVLAGLLSTWPARFITIWLADMAGSMKGDTFLGDLLYTFSFAAPAELLTKLIFTIPFIPFLIRRGSRLEMLVVCGCVGLGFAIENTMQYYQHAGQIDAFGQLLTANFFHFAATGLGGLVLCEFLRAPAQRFMQLLLTLCGIALAQGMYDGFMAVPGLRILSAASILSFMVLSLVFFHVLRQERDGVTDQLSISATLLCGMSVLTGTMLICASSQLGFFLALSTLAANAAGLIVVVCIFFRQLGRGMSAVNPSQV
ncbi:MAG: hypothetical protein ACO1QR_10795 [Chthoniobacteraceae bacterium]